jgi:hypothetical protein
MIDYSSGGPFGANSWNYNGLGLKLEEHISHNQFISNNATYDTNSPSNTILRSPLLNAAGTNDVTVSFDWEAGGETDATDGIL